jgi:glutathione S-transferase
MSNITLTAFAWVPPFAQGLVRDLRVRWALEEAGIAYQERLIGPDDQASDDYRRLQPFGQVPVYQEDDLTLFESGAIVLHVAEKSEALMPQEPSARARTRTWLLAALNTIEPPIQQLTELDLFFADEAWAQPARPSAEQATRLRLEQLAGWLDGREYLENRFTAADLMMTTVLEILRHTDLVAQIPVVDAYKRRCQDRPAYQRAVEAQLAPFAANAPAA